MKLDWGWWRLGKSGVGTVLEFSLAGEHKNSVLFPVFKSLHVN